MPRGKSVFPDHPNGATEFATRTTGKVYSLSKASLSTGAARCSKATTSKEVRVSDAYIEDTCRKRQLFLFPVCIPLFEGAWLLPSTAP